MEGSLVAYKVFTNGSTLQASELNENLMQQSIAVFSNAAARTSAITSPVEGQVTYLEDSNSYQYWNNGWIGLVPQSANAVINGGFDIWQRGTSFSSASLFQFTADRWFGNSFAGVTMTVSRETFTPGLAPFAGYEGQFFLRYSRGAGTVTGSSFLTQRIEDVRSFANQKVTVSFFAKAATAGVIGVSFNQVFGSGGSTSVVGTGLDASVTTSWNRYSLTFDVASVAGKTIGAGSYLDLVFALPVLFGNNTLDIWGVQLEAGPVATPFKRNANSLEGELAACQRYYFRQEGSGNLLGPTGFAYSTSAVILPYNLPVQMRVPPTSVEFSTIAVNDGVTNRNMTSVVLYGGNNRFTAGLNIFGGTGLTQFRPYALESQTSVAGFIGFSAEL
jgi:hypothetical protein